jgi:hypothetical protein
MIRLSNYYLFEYLAEKGGRFAEPGRGSDYRTLIRTL